MEYDRAGYRYDGKYSWLLDTTMFNPNRATTQGDYFSFSGGALVDRSPAWETGGVAEADCYICHLSRAGADPKCVVSAADHTVLGDPDADGTCTSYLTANPTAVLLPREITPEYVNLERNYSFVSGTLGPKYATTFGAARTGLISGIVEGIPGVSNPDFSAWTWSSDFALTQDYDGDLVIDPITETNVIDVPRSHSTPTKENCALCHVPDKSMPELGPANKPRGFTVFQKIMPAGTVADGDIVAGGNNAADWFSAKGRAEGGKRAESINDPANPDAHMDSGLLCHDCHYLLGGDVELGPEIIGDGIGNDDGICGINEQCEGIESPVTYPALTDRDGNVIQPAQDVLLIDHQFAKGNNRPDGKNMDQLDNTVTCQSCHTTRTHPKLTENGGTMVAPQPTHRGFPSLHFRKIDCRTCHIPVLNGPLKQVLADFTVGPYRNAPRAQSMNPAAAGGYVPLYLWRDADHQGGNRKIVPIGTMTVAIWADFVGGKLNPTFQRTAKGAAEALRAEYGDVIPAIPDGVYDWTLNQLQDGDKTLIVNTADEISKMVAHLKTAGITEPVMRFYFNQFGISHNVQPEPGGLTSKVLGSAAGGGCVMCHSSSEEFLSDGVTPNPNYNAASVGFFDKDFTLFNLPTAGLTQTVVTGEPRVNVKFPYKKANGASGSIALIDDTDGSLLTNTVNQGDVIGYDAAYITYLQALLSDTPLDQPLRPTARFSYRPNELQVLFNATASLNAVSYDWKFGDGIGTSTAADPTYNYSAAGSYNVSLTVTSADGLQDSKTITVTVVGTNNPPTVGGVVMVDPTGLLQVDLYDGSDDVDPYDTLQELTIFVNWGDGTTTTQKGAQPVDPISHTYLVPGTYKIAHAVRDTKGVSTSQGFVVTVPVQYTISGTVYEDATALTPVTISNAQVTLNVVEGGVVGDVVKRVWTDSTGAYDFGKLMPGTYEVSAVADGYTLDGPHRITLTSNVVQDIHALWTISGTIADGSTPPVGIAGVTVELYDTSVTPVLQDTTTTASNGTYSFATKSGDYSVDPQPATGTVSPDPSPVITVTNMDMSQDFLYTP